MGTTTKLAITLLLITHSACVLLWVVSGGLYYVSRVYGPSLLLDSVKGKDGLGHCGPTTDNLEDLIVQDHFSAEEALQLAEYHGSAIVPSVLTKETAETFRNYTMKANQEMKSAFVISSENRRRVMPPLTDPVVQQALKEIAEHPTLRPLIDALMGPGASLIAFSVITNLYGAEAQKWHDDTSDSAAGDPELFVPEYTLGVALQDTTDAMGATGLCPGTHVCAWPDYDYDEWEKEFATNRTLIEKYDGDFEWYASSILPCKVRATMKQGDALFYNTDTWHRGGAHTDPDAPERAVLFLSLASSRQGPDDNRFLSFGKVYSLDWRMWGQTMEDLGTTKDRPWRVWHAFGLFNGKESIRPWTLIDAFLFIYLGEDNGADFLSERFSQGTVWDVANTMVMYSSFAAIVYVAITLPLLLYLILLLSNRHHSTPGAKLKID